MIQGVESDMTIFGYYFGDAFSKQQNGAAVVADSELRDGFAPKIADESIGENRLQAVADFNAVFALSGSDEDEHAAIFLLRANSPARRKVYRVFVDGFAFERTDGNDGDLRLGFFVQFAANIFDDLFRVGRNDAREVADITLGTERLWVLCPGDVTRAKT